MKFLLLTLLIALFSFIAGLFFPWWSLAIVAFLAALLVPQPPGRSFLAGFLALFLLWGLLAIWIDVKNAGLLSQKVAQLLPLGGSSVLLILVTALLGALVGGLSAVSGSSIRPSR